VEELLSSAGEPTSQLVQESGLQSREVAALAREIGGSQRGNDR
jgi:hypothetical protein